MRFSFEEQLKLRLREQWLTIAAVILAGLALWTRLALLQFESVDYTDHLKDWFTTLATTPGLGAFKQPTWNYTPPYVYLLKLVSIPLAEHPLRAVKTLGLLFDALLATGAYLVVRQRFQRARHLALAAAALVLFSPTVILNSAAWAQCDAIYTALLLLCLVALMREQNALAFALFGLAFSFKLQAAFLLPLLGVVYLRRRFSVAYFLCIPAIYLLMIVPALVAGMPPNLALAIYGEQFELYRKLTYSAPNLYQWISNDYYDMFVSSGLALAAAVALGIVSPAVLSGRRLSPDLLVQLALVLTLALPFVTPKMHDRYFFPADVLSIVYALYFPRRFYVPVLVTLCSLLSYGPFLFGQTWIPMPMVAMIMLVPIGVVLYDYVLAFQPEARLPSPSQSSDPFNAELAAPRVTVR
jgi:Gpi18-like mannosyltransferase